jgi:ABC-type branched-subunit amino acid transport system substrate-binding protein
MQDHFHQTDPERRGNLEFVIVDSAGGPQAAVSHVNQLLTSRDPPAAVITADPALPLTLLAELGVRYRTTFITVLSYPPSPSSEWVCQVAPGPTQISAAIVGYLSTPRANRNAAVNIVSTAPGAARAAVFVDALATAGTPAAARIILPDPSGADLGPVQAAVRASQPNTTWVIWVPISAAPAIAEAILAVQPQAQIVIDAGTGNAADLLRAINARNLVVISPFAPALLGQRPLARDIDRRVREISGEPLAPIGAVTATAAQILAQAAVTATVSGTNYGEATRDSLRRVSIPAEELIVPWGAVAFDAQFQNQGARAVALALSDNRIVTVWPA